MWQLLSGYTPPVQNLQSIPFIPGSGNSVPLLPLALSAKSRRCQSGKTCHEDILCHLCLPDNEACCIQMWVRAFEAPRERTIADVTWRRTIHHNDVDNVQELSLQKATSLHTKSLACIPGTLLCIQASAASTDDAALS